VPAEEDWRLFHEDGSMYGAVLQLRRWEPPTPDWDHEHCEFCASKFPEDFAEGYVLEDEDEGPGLSLEERTSVGEGYRYVAAPKNDIWICPTCFVDFRERFGWRT
jgi:hypothetical protein